MLEGELIKKAMRLLACLLGLILLCPLVRMFRLGLALNCMYFIRST